MKRKKLKDLLKKVRVRAIERKTKIRVRSSPKKMKRMKINMTP